MAIARVQPGCQITMPENVLEKSHLVVGDCLEVELKEGRIVLTPVASAKLKGLTQEDEERLEDVHRKMDAIRHDLASAAGLTRDEADLAVRVGLIDASERWWWLEEWLVGERETEQEIRSGRIRRFSDSDAFFEDLES